MIRVSRRYRFSSSHRLHNPQLSDGENRTLYGKCNNPYGHGHNYVLWVSVAGDVDPDSGQLLDTRALDELVNREVIQSLDHRNLNTQVPEFADGGKVPTSEFLATVIQERLLHAWGRTFPAGRPALERVFLEETKKNKFELLSPVHLNKYTRETK
jgi:6-pyruvoyltetrahydropterin/6-carboxytetrahydropterin synthase